MSAHTPGVALDWATISYREPPIQRCVDAVSCRCTVPITLVTLVSGVGCGWGKVGKGVSTAQGVSQKLWLFSFPHRRGSVTSREEKEVDCATVL